MKTKLRREHLPFYLCLVLMLTFCLTPIQADSNSVTLMWDPSPDSEVVGYYVYRSTTSGSGFARINATPVATTQLTDTGIQAGATYYYVCTAVTSQGLESVYSNQVSYSSAVAPNQSPVALADSAVTLKNVAVTIDVLANDYDPDGDPLTITQVTTPSTGSAQIILGKEIRYTPASGFTGIATFSYTISDGRGGTASAGVTVQVLAGDTAPVVNNPPVAVDDFFEVMQNQSGTVNVTANDSDPDGDPLTVTSVGSPSHGSASIVSAHSVLYTPAAGFHGSDVFSYTISDGLGGTASANVYVTVKQAENQAPVASPDFATTEANKHVDIDVLANDYDPDGDPLKIVFISAPPNGTASLFKEFIRYRPKNGFTGTDIFNYTINDGRGGSASAQVTVTVVGKSAKGGNSVMFPASVEESSKFLRGTFIGAALLNPSDVQQTVSLQGLGTDGLARALSPDRRFLPGRGQLASTTDELVGQTQGVMTLTAEGDLSRPEGFFMIGDYNLRRLDGIGSGLSVATEVYMQPVRETAEEQTLLFLFNPNEDKAASFHLTVHATDGSVLAETTRTIAPLATIQNTLSRILPTLQEVESGYVRIRSDQPLGSFGLKFTNRSLEGVTPVQAIPGGLMYSPHFYVKGNSRGNTLLHLLNAKSADARVKVEVLSTDGIQIEMRELTIRRNSLHTLDLADMIALGPSEELSGSLKLQVYGTDGTKPVVLGSIQLTNNKGEARTLLPLSVAGKLQTIFPHVAQSPEFNIYTGVAVYNPTGKPVQLTLEAFDAAGQLRAHRTAWVAPNQRLIGLLSDDSLFGPAFRQVGGHLRVTGTGPVVAISLFGDYTARYLSAIAGESPTAQ